MNLQRKHKVLLGCIFIVLALIPIVMIARARVVQSSSPRVHMLHDMDHQGKYKSQQANPLFLDERSMRPKVDGTVARGELNLDDHLQRGRVDGEWAETFPMDVTEAIVERGQERYRIYCAPCHGLGGTGNGMVAQRAEQLQEGTWVAPLSYHQQTVKDRPVGHLFNTITNGIRTMPAYGDQIPVRDRWAIVSYIRALQRSQEATLDDVPPEQRDVLEQQQQQLQQQQQAEAGTASATATEATGTTENQ